jgi:hypothetical protein
LAAVPISLFCAAWTIISAAWDRRQIGGSRASLPSLAVTLRSQ